MLRKLLLPFLFVAFLASTALAQTGSITGTVTNEEGEPVPTANVFLVEIGQGDATNLEGEYTIDNVEPGTYTLRITFVGYADYIDQVTIEAGEELEKDVVLETGAVGLEELVVTGFGVESKIEYTGTASSVDVGQEIENVPVVNVGTALQGSVTGLQVSSASGTPGTPVDFNIRGVTSINAGGDPLIVLDGIPITGGEIDYGLSSPIGLLSSLDPQMIAEVTVLKGPVATAQYGSEGANGVVVITTKRGTAGETKYSFQYQYGTASRATPLPEVASAADHIMLYKEAIVNAELTDGDSDPVPAPADIPTPWWDGQTNTDWGDLMTNDSPITQSFRLGASGGSELATYYGSLSYQNSESVVRGSGYDRIGGQFNFTYDFNENIDVSNQFTGAFSELNGIREGNSYFANPLTSAAFLPQIAPAYNDDGSIYTGPLIFVYNPLYVIKNDVSRQRSYRLINSTQLNIDISENLLFTTEAGFDYAVLEEKTYSNPVHSYGANNGGYARTVYTRTFLGTLQSSLQYIWTINEDHTFDATVIGVAGLYNDRRIVASAEGFAALGLTEVASAATPSFTYGAPSQVTNLGAIAKAHYSYKDKIFVDGTLRREANSRFAQGYKWGTFYGIGAAYLLSAQDFIQNIEFIDLLKIRASYGETGNNAIGINEYQAFLGFASSYNGLPGIYPAQLGNVRLTWEKKRALEIGASFGLFNRVDSDVTVFRTKTSDLLYNVPLSLTTSFGSQITNVGELESSGIEASMEVDVIRTEDFLLSVNGNFTYVQNEVTQLPTDATGEELTLESFFKYNAVEGYAVGTWYMKEWAGVDPATGKPQWYVNDDDGTPGELTSDYFAANKTTLGATGVPTHYGSIGLRVNYKGFYAGASLYGSFGNKIYDIWARYQMNDGWVMLPFFSAYASQLDRWQEPGDITDVPRRIAGGNNFGNQHSSRFLYDGSYLRLKTVRLGYNVPVSLLNDLNVGVRGVNIFVVGRNLWTYKYDEDLQWDPQTGDNGFIDLFNQAQQAFTVGINLEF